MGNRGPDGALGGSVSERENMRQTGSVLKKTTDNRRACSVRDPPGNLG